MIRAPSTYSADLNERWPEACQRVTAGHSGYDPESFLEEMCLVRTDCLRSAPCRFESRGTAGVGDAHGGCSARAQARRCSGDATAQFQHLSTMAETQKAYL